MKPTDVNAFINDLNAGVFAQQIARALSDVAAGVVEHGKKGRVQITLDLTQIGESHQVKVTHKLDFNQPTKRGSRREDTALDTPMYVTSAGLSLFNQDPTANLFTDEQAPVRAQAV